MFCIQYKPRHKLHSTISLSIEDKIINYNTKKYIFLLHFINLRYYKIPKSQKFYTYNCENMFINYTSIIINANQIGHTI